MTPAITNIVQASENEWDSHWSECDYATYFHSREWALIWERYTHRHISRMRAAGLLVSFSDGKTALLVGSLRKIFMLLFPRYLSSPAGCFGGWISKDALSAKHQQLLVDLLLKQYDSLSLRMNPYDETVSAVSYDHAISDFTQVVSLENDPDNIYKDYSKGHRAAVKQARRFGVTIRQADCDRDWDDYYVLYRDSVNRWGISERQAYSKTFFDILKKLKSPHIKLWLAAKGDRAIAGAVCFYSRKHVVYWHSASSSIYLPLKANHLLVHELIQKSHEGGYRWFDFNTSGDMKGVIKFKKGFGAKKLACPIILKTGRWEQLLKMSA